MKLTPNLSTKYLPCPKPLKKEKSPPKPLGAGKKTASNIDAVAVLKKQFAAWGITSCELRIDDGCLKDNFLAFAHVERRRKLTFEDVKSPNKVCLACQNCHHIVDYIMDRTQAKELMEKIIKDRQKRI